MTNMPAIRDRSVVRSSVISSAKYCWSGSLPRLVKGSTTIDRRGATRGWTMEVVAAAATAAGGEEVVLGVSQTHQAITAMPSTAARAVATEGRVLRRQRRGAAIDTLGNASGIGNSAIFSG